MEKIKIHHHDGSIQVIRPNTDPTSENRFQGDVAKLADTATRLAYPLLDPRTTPNGRLYVKVEKV